MMTSVGMGIGMGMEMTGRRAAILREMGLAPLWKLRATELVEQPSLPAPSVSEPLPLARKGKATVPVSSAGKAPLAANERAQAIAAMDWAELRTSVAECRACELCHERKQAVFGVGDLTADWLLVGEGPGAEEDVRGEPFVGQAGKLLDAMLAAIGLRRGEGVYIANAVKCRPPGNRTPAVAEMEACRPFLERQIELLQPKLILALGRPAAQTLLQTEVKIAAVRGKLLKYLDFPVIVTYHPAYLLRTLTDKAKAWEDLCLARRTFNSLKSAESSNDI